MDTTLAILGIIGGGIVGFFTGKNFGGAAPFSGADASFFQTKPGSGGFVQGEVLKKKMKGKTFHWNRVGTIPAGGSRFEIRPKSGGSSILEPDIPSGVNDMSADVKPGTSNGTVYRYELWQVLATGEARMLEDPEITVSEM
jgi:hypothetical protein